MPATDKTVRDLKVLHVVFAASAITLFAAVFLMMYEDHSTEWRDYQRTAYEIDTELQRRKLAALTNEEYQATVKQLNADLEQASEQLRARADEQAEKRKEIRTNQQEVDLLNRKRRVQNAERDVARANYDLGVRDNLPKAELDGLFAEFESRQAMVDETTASLQQAEQSLEILNAELSEITASRTKIEKELARINLQVNQAHDALMKLAPESYLSAAKRKIMEWPIIDGFNSHLAIRQDWLPELMVTLGMTETARFDRCRTCHVNIDKAIGPDPSFPHGETDSKDIKDWIAKNEYPHPFSSHPRPDVYTTASSPHSVEKFGCTICHDGNGSGTSFQNAEHGPNHPVQALSWEKDYHYHSNHYWEYPMQPDRFVESSCIKCHHNVEELGVNPKFGATAPKVFEGYKLIQKYGCFGCHEIHGYDGGEPIGPDLRLEPNTPELAAAIAADPTQVAGRERKVGPSLAHIAAKTSEAWTEFWTANPRDFRDSTRMPRFFGLKNGGQYDHQSEEFEPVEISAMVQYLFDSSRPIELDHPADDYQPNAERGQRFFAEKGCAACHTHPGAAGINPDFGPELSQIQKKVRRNADDPNFSDWLYTWLREPTRYHSRTRMPDLFLEPEVRGEETIDPAADITAFLLSAEGDLSGYQRSEVSDESLDKLAAVYLKKTITENQLQELLAGDGRYPARQIGAIKGDEIELVHSGHVLELGENGQVKVAFDRAVESISTGSKLVWMSGDAVGAQADVSGYDPATGVLTLSGVAEGVAVDNRFAVNGVVSLDMKMRYVGRKTISRYGCYGCHEIPGFDTARPIGAALQDWGRKDTSKLALEHIEEWLHHHGEPDGSSTHERVIDTMKKMRAGGMETDQFASEEEMEQELAATFYYDALSHHGRPGFIWQKLRQPRSYDYKKTETKGYDERLRMPLFPFSEEEIEKISTFVLGLVANPPAEQYVYRPTGPDLDRVDGERLLRKYNCTSCHMLELPQIEFAANLDDLFATPIDDKIHPESFDLLMKLKPPRNGLSGGMKTVINEDGESQTLPLVNFRGMLKDKLEEEDYPTEYYYELWETLAVADKTLLPKEAISFTGDYLEKVTPARGGVYAEWLVEHLRENDAEAKGDKGKAWQKSPPPLWQEGIKVQTPWLYKFLLNPYRLRHETVLRMPKFNMSPEEAQTLANYFASVDNAKYPYQDIPEREAEYLAKRAHEVKDLLAKDDDYLGVSWKLLNGPLCVKCHSVGGRIAAGANDPDKNIRGPNLEYASERLRPEWTLLWIYNPAWITPYTSMPANFPANQQQFPDLFGGNAQQQVLGVRDALFNYKRMLERDGQVTYGDPPAAGTTEPAPAAEEDSGGNN